MKRPGEQGMSIIEVMVAITLMAILISLGAPSFFTGMQNRQIRTAAESIQNGLQLARTEALRRNRNVKFTMQLATQPYSWRVGCDPEDASVDATGNVRCPATIQTWQAAEGAAKAQVAPAQIVAATGAVAATPVFTGDLKFTPLGRTTTDTLPGGNLAEFQVTNPGGGTCVSGGGEMRCLSVRVTAAGQVRMCDPAVAAGDPRAC
jgi:type IV fimbrial biogenesis protein FimT